MKRKSEVAWIVLLAGCRVGSRAPAVWPESASGGAGSTWLTFVPLLVLLCSELPLLQGRLIQLHFGCKQAHEVVDQSCFRADATVESWPDGSPPQDNFGVSDCEIMKAGTMPSGQCPRDCEIF